MNECKKTSWSDNQYIDKSMRENSMYTSYARPVACVSREPSVVRDGKQVGVGRYEPRNLVSSVI